MATMSILQEDFPVSEEVDCFPKESGIEGIEKDMCLFPGYVRSTNFLWDSLEAKNAFHSEIVYLDESKLLGPGPTTTRMTISSANTSSEKIDSRRNIVVTNDATLFEIPLFFCQHHLPSYVIATFRYHQRMEQICTSPSSSSSSETNTSSVMDDKVVDDTTSFAYKRAAFFTDMMNLGLTYHRSASKESLVHPRRMAIYHNVFVNKYGLIINPNDCSFVRNGGCWFMNHSRIFESKLDTLPFKMPKSTRSSSGSDSFNATLMEVVKRDNGTVSVHGMDMATIAMELDKISRNGVQMTKEQRQAQERLLTILAKLQNSLSITNTTMNTMNVNDIDTVEDAVIVDSSNTTTNSYYDVSHLQPISYNPRTSKRNNGKLSITFANFQHQHQHLHQPRQRDATNSGDLQFSNIYYDKVIALSAGASGTWHFPMEVFVALAGMNETILQSSFIFITTPSVYTLSWLALLGISKRQLLVSRYKGGFMAKTLYVPEMGRCAEPSFTQIQWLRQLVGLPLDHHLMFHETTPSSMVQRTINETALGRTPTVLYLQRVRSRSIPNNHEVKSTIIEFTKHNHWNFVLHHEQYMPSLQEQIRRFSLADIIIAPHGAGLLFTAFAPPHACIIEIMPDIRPECFARIAYLRQLNYILLVTDQTIPQTEEVDVTNSITYSNSTTNNTTILGKGEEINNKVNIIELKSSLEKCRKAFLF